MITIYDPMDTYVHQASSLLNKFRARDISIFSWLNKFESVADYLGVPPNRKVEFFCIMIDFPESLYYVRDELIIKSQNFSYERISTAFCSVGSGLTATKIARIRFIIREQYRHETIEKYSESLLNIYVKCHYSFGNTNCLRHRFICGLYDEHVRNYLKTFRNIPFNDAVRLAVVFQNIMRNLENRLNSHIATIQEINETEK